MRLEPETVARWICFVGFVMLAFVCIMPPADAAVPTMSTSEASCPITHIDGFFNGGCYQRSGASYVTAYQTNGGGKLVGTLMCPDGYVFAFIFRTASGTSGGCRDQAGATVESLTASLSVVLPTLAKTYVYESLCPNAYTKGLLAHPFGGLACLDGAGFGTFAALPTVMDASVVSIAVTCPEVPLLTVSSVRTYKSTSLEMVGSCGYTDDSTRTPISSTSSALPRGDTVMVRTGLSVAGVFVFLIGLIVGWKMSAKPPQLLME